MTKWSGVEGGCFGTPWYWTRIKHIYFHTILMKFKFIHATVVIQY